MIYDKLAAGYDRAFAPMEKYFLRKWRQETAAFLPENSSLLEIGAGTGANFQFYPRSKHAVASEVSVKMLEIAREKTNIINLVRADAETLPFAENSFDAALATLVFCSIPQPEIAFAEIRRVVRNGGKIVLLEHVRPKNPLGFAFDFLNVFTVAVIEDHFNRRTAALAENAGLKIVEIRKKAFGIVNLIVCEVVK
jgi:ubiquinone/menaquinone biosynthesis C-methylase UbiE